MRSGLYLHPVGLVAGQTAAALLADGAALPLAGGPLAFAGAQLVEGTPGRTSARYLAAAELAAISDGDVAALRARVTAPRPAFAGLAPDRPRLMGIVNVTPDSFSGDGIHAGPEEAIAHARRLVAEGADLLDIGGESTRPGAAPVPLAEERRRVLPVIGALADAGLPLSVDTRKAAVMRAAAALGATVINDVSALGHDPDSAAAAAATGAFVILMHARGEPATMQDDPRYDDVVLDVHDELAARVAAAERAGIARARIAVDPGLGFAKTFAHNLALLDRLALLHGLGLPLVVGASRKGFVGHVTGVAPAGERVYGSVAMALAAVARGAQVVRAHDVAATRAALAAWHAVSGGADR